jgi:hypothetical protein
MPMEDARTMFREAVELGADYLVTPYHSCYRQHCKMQLEFGLEVHHYLSLIARSIGVPFEEIFKELRLLDNVDAAVDRLKPRIERLGYNRDEVRRYVQSVIYM